MKRERTEGQDLARLAAWVLGLSLLAAVIGIGALWWGLSRDGLVEPPALPTPEAPRAEVPAPAPAAAPAFDGETILQITTRGADLTPLGNATFRLGGQLIETDADGRATATAPSGSQPELEGVAPWAVIAPKIFNVAGPEMQLDVRLDALCPGPVRVLTADHTPAAGMRLSQPRADWTTLDDHGRADYPERRCGTNRARIMEPRGTPDRRSWSLPFEVDGDEEVTIHLEGPGKPAGLHRAAPAETREVSLTLLCDDCPAQVSCRGTGGMPNDRWCSGDAPSLRCVCPVEGASIWGTWLDVVSESGYGEPLGAIPDAVDAATLDARGDLGALQGRWAGLLPCEWRLRSGGHFIDAGDCSADGAFAIEGLRPAEYALVVGWGHDAQTASWTLAVASGEVVALGEVRPEP